MSEDIIGWRVLAIEYWYRGKKYLKDLDFTGHGRSLVQEDNPKQKLWLQPGLTYFKAGVEVRRICYPVFRKASKVTI